MNRYEAFKAAKEMVDDVSPLKGDRGHAVAGAVTGAERVKLICQTAEWLLAGEPEVHAEQELPAVPFSPPNPAPGLPVPPEDPDDPWWRANES